MPLFFSLCIASILRIAIWAAAIISVTIWAIAVTIINIGGRGIGSATVDVTIWMTAVVYPAPVGVIEAFSAAAAAAIFT